MGDGTFSRKVDAVKNEVQDLTTRLEMRDKERREQVGSHALQALSS